MSVIPMKPGWWWNRTEGYGRFPFTGRAPGCEDSYLWRGELENPALDSVSAPGSEMAGQTAETRTVAVAVPTAASGCSSHPLKLRSRIILIYFNNSLTFFLNR